MCRSCDHEGATDLARELLDDDRYRFAWNTVAGIRDWIRKNAHITPRQAEALKNIYDGAQRRKEGRTWLAMTMSPDFQAD